MQREKKRKCKMSTVALQNVWATLLGYNLTAANKRWLAEHLWEQAQEDETKEAVQSYTMAEIHSMIDKSEEDFASGRYYTMDDARAHRAAHLSQLLEA